ncbi:delta-6 fatty acid desaturase [Pilobolus umbonatus]|nr:delta-6 fatty acid desaturase [Pilobolus umbonatus]
MPPNTESDRLSSTRPYITHEKFLELIKQGDSVIIYESKVYKINSLIKKHPGGEASIRSALGRDVTDEIRSLHPPKVYEKMINLYYIGDYIPDMTQPLDLLKHHSRGKGPTKAGNNDTKVINVTWNGDVNKKALDDALDEIHDHHYKNLQQSVFAQQDLDYIKIREAYRNLEEEIKKRGLFKCNYWKYAEESCRYVALFSLSLYFTLTGTATWHFVVGALLMGAFWHQLVFTAHDAGHNGITGETDIDHTIGVLIAGCLGGLSLGWWKDSHNVHHIVTNHPEHDPDIQHLPFFAVSTRFFQNIYSTYYKRIIPFDKAAQFFIRYQHYLYYLVLSFGRFNLHRLSFIYLFFNNDVRTRTLELSCIGIFFAWYSTLISHIPTWNLRIVYILISYMITFPLHVQITLSHFGMSTEDKGPNEPFPAKMLRTTMDVDCPTWLDWFHGGLQYQAVHHLFPRIPRHNLRSCVPLVRQFCDETGLQYYMYNFSTGNGVILGALKSVADQVQFMNEVAKSNAQTWSDAKETK